MKTSSSSAPTCHSTYPIQADFAPSPPTYCSGSDVLESSDANTSEFDVKTLGTHPNLSPDRITGCYDA
jgi:hypothetical protein